MTTNYEHIAESGMDALLDWQTRSVTTCQCCVGCNDKGSESRKYDHRQYGEMSLFCRRKQIAWLESEYVDPDSFEPDSFEKLVCDLREAEGALYKMCDRLSVRGFCDDCEFRMDHQGCRKATFERIADRIEELANNQKGDCNG